MGDDSEKKEPPPPSLSPPRPSPPPPSLNPPPKTPPMPGKTGEPPPVIGGKVQAEPLVDEDEDEMEDGAMAPLNPRLLAGLIDGLVALSLAGTVMMILPEFFSKLAWVVWGGYWVTRDSLPFLKGQSIGKMAMKLRVEKIDGSEMIGDWSTALVRNAALLIAPFQLVEAIVLISRDGKPERGKRLGDEWAKTKVVVSRREESESTGEDQE